MGGLVNNKPFLTTFGLDSKRNSSAIGTIVAIYEIGCFFGAVATAFLGDKLGRRKSIMIGCVWLAIGCVLQASSFEISQMIVGRIVSGIGMGFVNSTVPVLQAEVSQPASRGLFACISLTTLNLGIMASYWSVHDPVFFVCQD